jgi:hypothetical protein
MNIKLTSLESNFDLETNVKNLLTLLPGNPDYARYLTPDYFDQSIESIRLIAINCSWLIAYRLAAIKPLSAWETAVFFEHIYELPESELLDAIQEFDDGVDDKGTALNVVESILKNSELAPPFDLNRQNDLLFFFERLRDKGYAKTEIARSVLIAMAEVDRGTLDVPKLLAEAL